MGTSGDDCSVQLFDNRIACDGPNAIPSHPGDLRRPRTGRESMMTVLIAKKQDMILLLIFDNGEFDPGSERTLAAWIRHASRTGKLPSGSEYSGERVSNAWETCPSAGDNRPNGLLIPHTTSGLHDLVVKGGLSLEAATEGWSRVPLACW